MMDYTAPPRALILCADSRLARLLENELAYMGISAHTAGVLPIPEENPCLLLANGDEFPLSDCIGLAEACGCPLLVFGREPTVLPFPPERGAYLRRPFSLAELGTTLRSLLEGTPASDTPAAPDRVGSNTDPSPNAESESPIRIAADGAVTVSGKTIPLTPAEQAVFEYLYARRGEAVPRETLAPLLGGGGNSVDVYICHLRAKIEKPTGRRMIHTVRGVGYRLDE